MEPPAVCRTLVVGPHLGRMRRVFEFLEQNESYRDVELSFVPCRASFGSYPNETGQSVRYLVKMEHVPGCEESQVENMLKLLEDPFDAIVVGMGIEDLADVAAIAKLLQTLLAQSEPLVPMVLQPNEGFESMKEELVAYKSLLVEEKELHTKAETMGPAKMARFARECAHQVVDVMLEAHRQEESVMEVEEPGEAEEPRRRIDLEAEQQTSYRCRQCRHILFVEADLEDPPHTPARHDFGRQGGGTTCQSYFLGSALDWMHEGKFSCPQCDVRLGTLKWSGAQCSCGTWVVPAIQIPKSKVDQVELKPDIPNFIVHHSVHP